MTRRGDLGEHYADALSYALALANRPAFDRHKIHAAIMRHELVLDVQRERGLEPAGRLAWRVVDQAVARAQMHPAELWKFEVPHRLIRYRHAADAANLPATDRRALEALYITALIARSTKFHLSSRTWGLRAGMSAMSASRAGKRLRARNLLRLERRHTRKFAALYRVRSPRTVTQGLPPLGGSHVTLRELVRVGVSLIDSNGFERRLIVHDAFRPSALGDKGWKISRLLSDEIALADPNDDTLRTLESYDAVRRVEDGWLRVLEPDFFRALDQIANDAGTTGTLERERGQYERERARRDKALGSASCALFVTGGDPLAWWSTWWGSLSERRARAA